MQQVEWAIATLAMRFVEPPDAIDQELLDRQVTRHPFQWRIERVAQEHEP